MKTKQTGFTLVELLIAMTIIGILTSVSYPSYVKHIQKTKRAEAESALMSLAAAMEQWRVENNNNYTGVTLGTATTAIFSNQVPSDCDTTTSVCTNKKTYTLSISRLTASNYTLKATPFVSQIGDECGDLTLDSTGIKGAVKTTDCWE